MAFLPFAALFVAFLLCDLARIPRLRFPAVVGGVALIVYAVAFTASYVQAFGPPDPRVQASDWMLRNVPSGEAITTSTTNDLNIPQLKLLGYPRHEVKTDATQLAKTSVRYLILADLPTLMYEQVLRRLAGPRSFLAAVRHDYCEVIHFENSDRWWFINSKPRGGKLAQDWILPNPRITILERQADTGPGPCLRYSG